jgi:aspartyl protease family protein
MATGSMIRMDSAKLSRHFTALLALCLASCTAWAVDVGLAGIMGSKALLMFDGGQPQAVRAGQMVNGVKLLSVGNDQVMIEIDGKKRSLRVGQHAVGSGNEAAGKIVLTADGQGHFFTTGTVNGTSVRFLVDTGATMISLGTADARRIGIDTSRGQRGMSNTANGQAPVTKIRLDTVRVGEVTLYGIDALVHESDMPIALLGMSFLNRMEMQHDGSTMTLKKRF